MCHSSETFYYLQDFSHKKTLLENTIIASLASRPECGLLTYDEEYGPLTGEEYGPLTFEEQLIDEVILLS